MPRSPRIRTFLITLFVLSIAGCGLPSDVSDLLDGAGGSGNSDDAFGGDGPVPGSGSGSGGDGSGSGGDSGGPASGAPSCVPVAELACGSHASGDTSDFNSGTTNELDSYPIAVGNYDAREIAYSFVAPHSGAVSFQLVDAVPTDLDHDIFLLWGGIGCTAEAALERGHNSLSFLAEAGERYYLVVDGFNGDEGAYEVAVECGPGSGSSASTPDQAIYGDCLFGWLSQHLKNAPHLMVTETGRFASAAAVPPLLGQQLVQGIELDGWAPGVSTLEQVFNYIDPDGLYVNSVLDALTGDRYTWVKFYAGDTEVGYLYPVGSLDLVAVVSDGDVINCTVSGPS
jgi:hypothetical protein